MIYHLAFAAWRKWWLVRLIFRHRRLIWRWRKLIWRVCALMLRWRGLLLKVWHWRRPLRWAVGAVTVIAAGVRFWPM